MKKALEEKAAEARSKERGGVFTTVSGRPRR